MPIERSAYCAAVRRFPVLLVLGCVLSSCDRGTSAPSPVPTEVIRQARVPSAEVERLEALGYVDVDEAQDGRTGVVVRDAARSYPGYNVFTNAHLCSTQLVDAQGALVHSWSIAPCFRWDNTSLFPNGDLLVVGRATPPAKDDLTGAGASSPTGRYVARIGWSGEVMWQKWLPAHHDAQLTPHGEIAVLTERRRVVPGTDSDRKIKDHAVTLLSMAGETSARRRCTTCSRARRPSSSASGRVHKHAAGDLPGAGAAARPTAATEEGVVSTCCTRTRCSG